MVGDGLGIRKSSCGLRVEIPAQGVLAVVVLADALPEGREARQPHLVAEE